MSSERDLVARVDLLRRSYEVIGGPSKDHWERVLSLRVDQPLSLINLFAFRDVAEYGDPDEPEVPGRQAFDRYAAVSAPTLASVGGRFVHFGNYRGSLVGDQQPWDLIVIGEYPSVEALVALHENPDYRASYRHRVAACTRQQVLISS